MSAGKVSKRGIKGEFQNPLCVIWSMDRALVKNKKDDKSSHVLFTTVLNCKQDMARFVDYAGIDSKRDLWHARSGHTGENGLAKPQRATIGVPAVEQATAKLCGGCLKKKKTVK